MFCLRIPLVSCGDYRMSSKSTGYSKTVGPYRRGNKPFRWHIIDILNIKARSRNRRDLHTHYINPRCTVRTCKESHAAALGALNGCEKSSVLAGSWNWNTDDNDSLIHNTCIVRMPTIFIQDSFSSLIFCEKKRVETLSTKILRRPK